MDIIQILAPAATKVTGKLSSKKRLFQDLAELVSNAHGLTADKVANALQERESLGPTGVGHGVALPHARLDEIDNVVGAFVRLETPLDFDAADRQPVDLIFALFAPEDASVEHLKALALVSRTMRDAELCSKLRANADAATLHALLTTSSESKAA